MNKFERKDAYEMVLNFLTKFHDLGTLPAFKIGITRRAIAGSYCTVDNVIFIREKTFEDFDIVEVIAHEIAHWLQYFKDGDTDCYSSRYNPSPDVIKLKKDHTKLTHIIEEHAKGFNFDLELLKLRKRILMRKGWIII